jgi:hypothetical protein
VVLASDPLNPPSAATLVRIENRHQESSRMDSRGKFVVTAGESKDLDLDFNACRSIVTEGSRSFRLKPVLRAGEVAQQAAINGTVIDAGTQAPIGGGNTVVALEQNDGNGVNRVVMETVADANGAFSFCPVAGGTYDIVVAAINGASVTCTREAIVIAVI